MAISDEIRFLRRIIAKSQKIADDCEKFQPAFLRLKRLQDAFVSAALVELARRMSNGTSTS